MWLVATYLPISVRLINSDLWEQGCEGEHENNLVLYCYNNIIINYYYYSLKASYIYTVLIGGVYPL